MDHRLAATLEMAREFTALFVNRRACTVQSTRPHPETGRHYYYRPKPKEGGLPTEMRNGAAERIRLWGIDCPEKRQPFGTRATQFTGDAAFGKDVKVLVRDVDRYGRTVGEVILPDGRSLNRELVRAEPGLVVSALCTPRPRT